MPKFVNLIAFLLKLISKEHVVVIMEFPDWFKLNENTIIQIGDPPNARQAWAQSHSTVDQSRDANLC